MTIKQSIIDKAIEVAKKSNVRRGKVGAVLFTSSGEIVAFTSNKTCNGQKNKFTIHAEEYLISKAHRIKASKRLGKLYVLVVRWTKKHGITIAKPCKLCTELLKATSWEVFYSDRDGRIKMLGRND